MLDPFSVYTKGEALLRQELGALSAWHLVNIISAYRLSREPLTVPNRRPAIALIETIVAGVAREFGVPNGRAVHKASQRVRQI